MVLCVIINGDLSCSDKEIVEFEILRGVRKMSSREEILEFMREILATRRWGLIRGNSERQRCSKKLAAEL